MNNVVLFYALELTLALSTAPLTLTQESRGLLGPIILLIVLAVLNVFVLAFAFRLRRYFRDIGGQKDEE